MGKIDNYIAALKELGDGRYHYWDGSANGIGCSEYTRLALVKAGILKNGETFHAGNGIVGILADTSRFTKIAWNPNNLQAGDILWSQGHHVATWDGVNGVYEAAPENSHGICDNKKTGVGHWSNHTYWNCGTGSNTWTCIYRIVDNNKSTVAEKKEATPLVGKLDAFIQALPTIQNGSKGDIVKVLQTELKRLGYYTGSLDGEVGAMTISAIKAFQQSKNIAVDGIFGQVSWNKLLK